MLIGAGVLASTGFKASSFTRSAVQNPESWKDVKSAFNIDPDVVQMAHFFLTSHPKPVRDAIEKIRDGLDKNPVGYFFEHEIDHEAAVLNAAAEYLNVNPEDIALTDSTTMGLGLTYNSLDLREDQEILTTTHDHYSTEISLQLRSERTGAKIRRISLYEDGMPVTVDQIVKRLTDAVSDKTRYVVITWVHSCTGMKLPVKEISFALNQINKNRNEEERILLCVDGVHGLGVENITLPELGCDFFIAGTHKWINAPRGTGLVWAKPDAWKYAHATIPTFNMEAYQIWMNARPPGELPPGAVMTPGGFHSFEHRWAVDKGFEFHKSIGKEKIQKRIHSLNTYLKEELLKINKVRLITPMSEKLSSGITCFEIEGMDPIAVVDSLWEKKIAASATPYKTRYVRLAPSLVTLEEDVDKALNAVRSIV